MKWCCFIFLSLLVLQSGVCTGLEQTLDQILTPQMQKYENDIQSTYLEYQKIYYEKKSSVAELRAFEDIISVYVTQILELHKTLSLSGFADLETPRDIVARALIYRALIYLEKAPLNVMYYEKACYDYYSALNMFKGVEDIPVIFKQLPYKLFVGNTEVHRLIDVIDRKGNELYNFGKVELKLRNFKITTDLKAEDLEFVQFKPGPGKAKYTFINAEQLIKDAFREMIEKEGKSSTFLSLPEGSYYIRSKSKKRSMNYYLMSTLYVRANQQHVYIVEPLADWVIMYEQPTTRKLSFVAANTDRGELKNTKNNPKKTEDMAKLIALEDAINSCMDSVNTESMFNLGDTWIRSKFSSLVADVIYSYSQTAKLYNTWSPWMVSWIIAKEVTHKHSPDNEVPTELIKLIYQVLKTI